MSLDMNPEIRSRWVAALRSGEYDQDQKNLHSDAGFCCLGVLCDLAVRSGLPVDVTKPGVYRYDKEATLLPASVSRWAGLTGHGGNAWVDAPGIGRIDLATLNDDGWTFDEIAALINGEA